jgi:hypothetical protein
LQGCRLIGKPESEGKCERMNPHTPKGTSTLGVKVLVDSGVFREQMQGLKLIGLKIFLYHWKPVKTWIFKMGSHDPFGNHKHKLW